MGGPITIAHRGEPVGHRENTLGAFAAALGLGADWVEIDLRRTRDGEIVVLHDQTLERLWEVDASVGTSTGPRWPGSGTATCASRRCARSSRPCRSR